MDLRMKATLLVVVITFMQRDGACCRFLEKLGLGKVVPMRDANGVLTHEGKIVMSVFFGLLTYMVMSRVSGRK